MKSTDLDPDALARERRYFVERSGLRWRIVYESGGDDLIRPVHPIAGTFWRWKTAARLASCFNSTLYDGIWIGEHAAPRHAVSTAAMPTRERLREQIAGDPDLPAEAGVDASPDAVARVKATREKLVDYAIHFGAQDEVAKLLVATALDHAEAVSDLLAAPLDKPSDHSQFARKMARLVTNASGGAEPRETLIELVADNLSTYIAALSPASAKTAEEI